MRRGVKPKAAVSRVGPWQALRPSAPAESNFSIREALGSCLCGKGCVVGEGGGESVCAWVGNKGEATDAATATQAATRTPDGARAGVAGVVRLC